MLTNTTDIRRLQAQFYAAQVRERNKPPCDCEACRMNEMLPAVQQIVANWPAKKPGKVRRVK